MKKLNLQMLGWILIPISCSSLLGQEDDTDLYVMDPFVVATEAEGGRYLETETLAGSRLKTDVKDLTTSISLISRVLLDDIGATDSESLLSYTLGTEVGGASGNFSGLEAGANDVDSGNLLRPQSNTRVRGLASADNTRGFFGTAIPWDSYNVDRVEIQRGPNSILFGVGSPAGIVNANLILAAFRDSNSVKLKTDEYGSARAEIDVNREIIEKKLAVRFAGMIEDKRYMQRNNYERDNRQFVAATYREEWLGEKNPTTLRVNFEQADISANRPRSTPPIDKITPFFASGSRIDGLDRQVFDPQYAGQYLVRFIPTTNAANLNELSQPWLERMGNFLGAPNFYYDNGNDSPSSIIQAVAVDLRGLDSEGAFEGPNALGVYNGNIQGLPGGEPSRLLGIADYATYARAANKLDPSVFPGANKGFYPNRHLTDPSVFNFFRNSLDGPNKQELQEWTAYNLALSQSFLSGRFGFEVVYDYQDYEDERIGKVIPEIGVDLSSHYTHSPTRYFPDGFTFDEGVDIPPPSPGQVTEGILNPNVGRAYAIHAPVNDGQFTAIERESVRATAFMELRADDFFEKGSFFERLLGRQIFTGLYSRDEVTSFDRSYDSYKMSIEWAEMLGATKNLSDLNRIPYSVVYLSGDLRNQNSANGLHLNPVQSRINPAGAINVDQYFDATWNAPADLAFDAPYTDPLTGAPLTQSENPNNYVGVTSTSASVLSRNEGDIDELTRTATRSSELVESNAFIYQGYFWDGLVVGTLGWREDTSEVYAASGPKDPITEVQSANFPLIKPDAVNTDAPNDIEQVVGETVSWGVMVHATDILKLELPGSTRFSVFYNEAENFNPSIRVGFDGQTIPNQAGKTEEYGVVVSTLNDRLTLRATHYETRVTDQTFRYDVNQFVFRRVPAWTTTAAIRHEAYWEGVEGANTTFFSNPGWNALSGAQKADIVAQYGGNPTDSLAAREATRALPQNQEIINGYKAWYDFLAQNQDYWQTWFDQFSFDIDLDPIVNGTPADRVNNTFLGEGAGGTIVNTFDVLRRGPGSIPSRTGGRIFGKFPTSSADTLSEGWELETSAQLTDNWNLTFNASQTDASLVGVNQAFQNHLELLNSAMEGPAGLIPRQGNGGSPVVEQYDSAVYQPYLFALEKIGTTNDEIREWRFNLITNYRFKDGRFKGLSIGGAFRCQDQNIMGYGISQDEAGEWRQDINKPIFSDTEDALDIWFSYSRQLTKQIRWSTQLNLRNVGKEDRLVAYRAGPDGTPLQFRINEGFTWAWTNTFTF